MILLIIEWIELFIFIFISFYFFFFQSRGNHEQRRVNERYGFEQEMLKKYDSKVENNKTKKKTWIITRKHE